MNHGTSLKHQASETFLLSAVLSFSGGLQDAYTYWFRDRVFANAQTGNVVLMSQYFMTGDLKEGVQYMAPLFAFAFGVLIAEYIGHRYKGNEKIHWRQIVLILEILILFAVGFIPSHYNMLASSLVSLSCAMQVEAFKTVHGFGYASTMCIGNLRSGMESLSLFIRDKDKNALIRVYYYCGVIISFAVGAGVGGIFSEFMGLKTIWMCCMVLIICCLLMMRKRSLFHTKNKSYYFKTNKKGSKENNSKNKNNKSNSNKNIYVDIDINTNYSKINNTNGKELHRSSLIEDNELDNNSFIQNSVDIDDDIVQENFSSIQKIIVDDTDKTKNNISILNTTIEDFTIHNISLISNAIDEDKKQNNNHINITHTSIDEDATKNNISKIHNDDEIILNDNSTIKNLIINNTAPNYIDVQNLIIDDSGQNNISD